MTETSGKSKVRTAVKHLENVEVLLGGLPKYATENGRKQKVRDLITKIVDLQNEIKDIFKDDLLK